MHPKVRPWVACCLGIATNIKPQRKFGLLCSVGLARGGIPLGGPIDGSETLGGARPDDLVEITYLDHVGNAMTGMRLCNLPGMPVLRLIGISWSARALF